MSEQQKNNLIDTIKRKITSSTIQILSTVTLNFDNGDVSIAKDEWYNHAVNPNHDSFIHYVDKQNLVADEKGY